MEICSVLTFTLGNIQKINLFCATLLLRLCDISLHTHTHTHIKFPLLHPPTPTSPSPVAGIRPPTFPSFITAACNFELTFHWTLSTANHPVRSGWEVFNLEYLSNFASTITQIFKHFLPRTTVYSVYGVSILWAIPLGLIVHLHDLFHYFVLNRRSMKHLFLV